MNWEDRTQVKKGNYGERLVDAYLESRGFVVYSPSTAGAHAFDRLAVRDKREMVIAECKTKAARTYYEDTGIDCSSYEVYRVAHFEKSIPVYLFFVDENLKRIYGNRLDILIQPRKINGRQYPLTQRTKQGRNIIYFPLVAMGTIAELSDGDATALKNLSTRNYNYR